MRGRRRGRRAACRRRRRGRAVPCARSAIPGPPWRAERGCVHMGICDDSPMMLAKTNLPPPIADRTKVPAERPGQPGGRRDTNRKERTKALADAALALFLERGIEAVTIEDITQKAGVAKGSFYRYFDDKTALTESLFAPLAAAVVAMFDESLARIASATTKEEAFQSYEAIGDGLGRILLGHSDVVLLYLQENRAPAQGARAPARKLAQLVTEKAIEHTRHARERGLLRPFPAELSTL